MGNVHRVIQVEPFRSTVGAVLPVRAGRQQHIRTALDARLCSYMALTSAGRRVCAGDVSYVVDLPERAFVAVRSGGKGNYADVRDALDEVAAHLADALFFIEDEYVGYVERWRLLDGTLDVTQVADRDATVALHLAEAYPQYGEFAYRMLTDLTGDEDWRPDEPDAAVVHAMQRLAPEHWPTWLARGKLLARTGPAALAVPLLRQCLAAMPDGGPARADALVHLVDALRHDAPREALADARAAAALWRQHDRMDGLELLALLEATAGDRTAAMDAWLRQLTPPWHPDTATRLYDMACLRTLEGRYGEAGDWLRVACALDPDLAERVDTDPDLADLPASLRDTASGGKPRHHPA